MLTLDPFAASAVTRDCQQTTGGSLILASTPLHTFFALGLLAVPLRQGTRRLWLIDQPPGAHDWVAEAIVDSRDLNIEVRRFDALRGHASARLALRNISKLAAHAAPATLLVGMDHRLEFYAALRGCPAANRVYIDDGLYSYLPHRNATAAWRERLSNWRRRLKYGVSLERPALVGGSTAVQAAYVLLPGQVHAGLAGKLVRALEASWFEHPAVVRICLAAAALAGFDASQCAAMRLLVLLPHPRLLEGDAALRGQLADLVRTHAAGRDSVALKSHPAALLPAHQQLGLTQSAAVEVPSRLPVEVLAPLLRGARVVGSATTALLSLTLLSSGLKVFRLPSSAAPVSAFEAGARRVCDAAGVRVFDSNTLI